jgi:L-ascorbate metabolism protein UlaG (beta-lactamase superfamily)
MGNVSFRYLGHSAFEIQYGGKTFVLDPFITPNDLAASINVEELNPDYILLTHGHGDHVADVPAIAKQSGALILSNFEIVTYYESKGFKGHPMNHGGTVSLADGIKIKFVNAVHSSVLPDGTYGGNPGGFVLYGAGSIIYISGDTCLTMDMKLLPLLGLKPDICIFPIGDNFTMGPQEAAMASDFVECDTVIGCHYDTFGYIKIDHEEATSIFTSKGKSLYLPEIGTTLTF